MRWNHRHFSYTKSLNWRTAPLATVPLLCRCPLHNTGAPCIGHAKVHLHTATSCPACLLAGYLLRCPMHGTDA
jgi:hypothetical protein